MKVKVEDLVAVINQIRFDIGAKTVEISIKKHNLESGQLCDVLSFVAEPIKKERYDGALSNISNVLEVFDEAENSDPIHASTTTYKLKTKQ
jgi:hypothetical protein